jgi:hypothetical protein
MNMDRLISGAFTRRLEYHRARFNARFAEARRFQPRLDSEMFKEHLRSTVAPIVEAADRAASEKTEIVVEVLYDLSLDLLGKEFLGPNSRYPFIVDGWRSLLPRLPRFVAESPRAFVGSVTNALYNLSITPGARPGEWAASLLKLAEVCPDAPTLLKAAQVAAWRAGLAHYRLPALKLCRELPPTVAFTALDLAPQANHPPLGSLIDLLKADPWLRPESNLQSPISNLQIVSRVGAFRGFGGLFLTPPKVTSTPEGQFVVWDGDQAWLLTADLFGATLHRMDSAARPEKGQPCSHFQIDPTGRVSKIPVRRQKLTQSQTFSELAGFTTATDNSTTLAVTTPLSHAVYLIALVSQ